MPEELVYDACVEARPDGTCIAQLRDLPACFARGPDESVAIRAVEASLPSCFAWLSRHDDYTPVMHGPFRVVAAEVARVADAASGAFFESDAEPLSAEDLDWYLALLDWSYQDYEAQLSMSVPEGTLASLAAQAAYDLCETQLWLLAQAGLSAAGSVPVLPRQSPFQLIATIHHVTLDRVRAASEIERSRVQDLDSECWSLRKVLRRSILLVREGAQALG